MDLPLFFTLPLIGGFAFVTGLWALRWRSTRQDSSRWLGLMVSGVKLSDEKTWKECRADRSIALCEAVALRLHLDPDRVSWQSLTTPTEHVDRSTSDRQRE